MPDGTHPVNPDAEFWRIACGILYDQIVKDIAPRHADCDPSSCPVAYAIAAYQNATRR